MLFAMLWIMNNTLSLEIQDVINLCKPYGHPAIVVQDGITSESFVDYLYDALYRSLLTCGLDESFLTDNDPTRYSGGVHASLIGLRTHILSLFDETLTARTKPYRQVDKLAKQYSDIRDSRNPSKARMEALMIQIEELREEAISHMPDFMKARLAEEYTRPFLDVYDDQTTASLMVCFKALLRTSVWNPATDTFTEAVEKFSK